MRTISALVLAVLLGTAAGCGKKPEASDGGGSESGGPAPASDDLAALQGKWGVTGLEIEFPPDSPAEQHKKDRKSMEDMLNAVEITVNSNLITATLPNKKEPGYAVFKLDASKSPKEVDFNESDAKGKILPSKEFANFDWKTNQPTYKEGPPHTIKAIYKIEGDTLTVAAGMGKNPPRPTEFKAIPPKNSKEPGGVSVVHLKKK